MPNEVIFIKTFFELQYCKLHKYWIIHFEHGDDNFQYF